MPREMNETKSGERRRSVRNNWTRVMEGKMQGEGKEEKKISDPKENKPERAK